MSTVASSLQAFEQAKKLRVRDDFHCTQLAPVTAFFFNNNDFIPTKALD
jgi:hypothetical protein